MKYLEIDVKPDCQFIKDFKHEIKVNGNPTPLAIYNVMITKRDLMLFEGGILPHRGWSIKQVAIYFGLSGKIKKTIIPQFADLVEKVRVLYKFVRPYPQSDHKKQGMNQVATTSYQTN